MQTRNRIVGIVLGSAFGLLGGGLTPSAHAQSSRSAAEAARLRTEYPGISVHFPIRDAEGELANWAGAEQVFGRPMPVDGQASETPEAAVLDWLDAHSDVFLGTGEAAKPDFVVVDSSPLPGDRVVVRFEQRIQDPRRPGSSLSVYGTHGRGIAYESVGGWVVSYMSCAALDVPGEGLETPSIPDAVAVMVAATQSKASREHEMRWREPVLVAMGVGKGQTNPRAARPVWRVRGSAADDAFVSFDVFVDATDGRLISELDASPARFAPAVGQDAKLSLDNVERLLLVAHQPPPGVDSAPIVYGTVTGKHLLGEEPYQSGSSPYPLSCTTPSITLTAQPVPHFLVEVLSAPGGTVLASTRTDENGDYEIDANISITSSTRVRFTPQHSYFTISMITEVDVVNPDPELCFIFDSAVATWEGIPGVEKVLSFAGEEVDYVYENNRGFGPDTESKISDITAWQVIDGTRKMIRSRLSPNATYSALDDQELHVFSTDVKGFDDACIYGAWYFSPSDEIGSDPEGSFFGEHALLFNREGVSTLFPINLGYSTVVSHEYGHYLLNAGAGITVIGHRGIHEGFADTIATRYYETDIVAHSGFGCIDATTPKHIRDYAAIDSSWSTANNCASSEYTRAQQLVLIWRDLEDRMDNTPARQESFFEIFAAWSRVVTPDPLPAVSCGAAGRDRAARDATFYEVLIVDDDDNNLANGTPHATDICAAFGAYFLPENNADPDPCAETVGRCVADLNADGIFDMYDYQLLLTWMQNGDPRADLDGDRRITQFDVLYLFNESIRCIR